MYYFFNDNQAVFNTSRPQYRLINKSQSESAVKVFLELLNLDYEKLYEDFKNTDAKVSDQHNIKLDYYNNKIDDLNACEQTKLILKQLIIQGYIIRKEKSNMHKIINETIKHIKKIIALDDFSQVKEEYILFYFDNVLAINLKRQAVFFDSFANSAIAPVLFKYESNYDRFAKNTHVLHSNNVRYGKKHSQKDYSEIINKYLDSLGMTEMHRNMAKKLFEDNPFSLYPTYVIKNNNVNFSEDEMLEYIKLLFEYHNNDAYLVVSLPELLVALFSDCIKHNIRIGICQYCGNVFQKNGRQKYCNGCKSLVKKEQEKKRIYRYNGKSLKYNNILKNYEKKVANVIYNIKKMEIDDKIKKRIVNELKKNSMHYYYQKNKEASQNEIIFGELLYNISNLYTVRNSLLNLCKNAIENEEEIKIKRYKIDGNKDEAKIIEDDLVIKTK